MIKKGLPGLLVILITLAMVSCDKTEGEGGGGLDPGSDRAEVVEGFVCSGVFDNKPLGIGNDFIPDDKVYLWLSWGNVYGEHRVRFLWLDPNDHIISEQTIRFNSTSGRQVVYSFIDTTSSAPVGRWIVEVHIDGHFVRSYAFWMIPNL